MRNIALLLMLCFLQTALKAQMVGSNGYLKATSVEVGVNGAGGYEGVDVTTSPPLAGMHPRGGGSTYFGFVANPQVNAWATYNGDFFTPGSPENGWGFEIGTSGGAAGANNCAGDLDIPGSMTWAHTYDCYTADWQGDATSGTDLHFHISYLLQETDLYYTTTVSITNNTTATIPELYYYRNVDPDNNESLSGTYDTQNTIENQPASGSCSLALVSGAQPASTGSSASYLGLAAVGANWKACYGGFTNRDGSDLWNGVGFTQTVGSTAYVDEAISLAYKITNLAPGATETFKFVTILDAASATNAIDNLLYFTYPGSASAPPAACTPYTDVVHTCGAPVNVSVNGPIVNDYDWTWSPGTGLSSTTGASVTASPPTTTSYTITGTPITPCVSPVTLYVIVEVTPGSGANPAITPVSPVCETSPPFNLVVDSAGGVWSGTGITNTGTGTFSPSVAGAGVHMVYYTIGASPCLREDSTQITVLNAGSANITQGDTTICMSNPPYNYTAASPGGTWSGTGITDPANGTFDPSVSGPGTFMIHYVISGTCPSEDSVRVTVGSGTTPVTAFSYTGTPYCIASPNPVPLGTAGFTTGGIYSSTPGLVINSSTGIVNMGTSSPGTYTVTYTVAATGCGPAGTSTTPLVIQPLTPAVTSFSYVTPVCAGDSAHSPLKLPGFTEGGLFASTPPGLVIDDSTGVIDVAGSSTGTYTITYTVQRDSVACRAAGTNSTTFTIHPLPSIVVSPDAEIYIGESTNLYAYSDYNAIYNWHPGAGLVCDNNNCDTAKATPMESTTYCAIVVDSVGCIDSLCTRVQVVIPCETNRNLIVPDAFTPNGDGVNDELCLFGWSDCVATFQIFIYDRWGEKVFESVDPKFCWDGVYKGKLLDPAVFVYYIKATYITEGATITSPKNTLEITKKGNITLVR